tara:strand:+ start:731 stop:1693 length:963 start_codon:yes stop_codon:yes gene_type:complete
MSKNYNYNWEHLTQMKLNIGDLVIVKPNYNNTTEMAIVIDMDLTNGYTRQEIINKFPNHNRRLNSDFVKDQHNSKSYRYVVLAHPSKGNEIYLFHPTYSQDSWRVSTLDRKWTTPAQEQIKNNINTLRKKARAYEQNAMNDWSQKYGVMKEYNNYIQELHGQYGQGSRHRSRSHQYNCAEWCLEKEKKELYNKYADVLIDVIDNRWDKNPKTLRGMIEDAIPLAEKEYINIDVRIGREQIQYDINFKHDQDYKYNFIDWDMDDRDTEYNNIIAACPAELKEYISIEARDFWGTTDWYNTRVKDTYHHTSRYEYRLTDEIE